MCVCVGGGLSEEGKERVEVGWRRKREVDMWVVGVTI